MIGVTAQKETGCRGACERVRVEVPVPADPRWIEGWWGGMGHYRFGAHSQKGRKGKERKGIGRSALRVGWVWLGHWGEEPGNWVSRSVSQSSMDGQSTVSQSGSGQSVAVFGRSE